MVNTKIPSPPTLCSTTKVIGETYNTSTNSYSSSLENKSSSLPSFVKCTYFLAAYNSTTFKICRQKCANITYADASLDYIFSFHYQHQGLELVRLWMVWIIILGQFTWVKKIEIQVTRPSLPVQSVFVMVSTLLCKLCSTLFYQGRRTHIKQENIIVNAVSTNRCLLCGTLFYINRHKNFKHQNIFVGIMTVFKSKSQ